MAGLVGGEFFSVVNLVITRQEQLRAIDPENNLLKCNISFNGGDLGYDPYLYELFGSIAINEAMDKLYWRLESEVRRQTVLSMARRAVSELQQKGAI